MRLKKDNAAIVLSLILVLVSLADQAAPGARYAKYLIPPICIIFWLYNAPHVINKSPELRPFYLYAAVSLIYVLTGYFGLGSGDFTDVYFVISYAAPFFLTRPQRFDVGAVFSSFAWLFIALSVLKLIFSGDGFSFDILGSNSTLEHSEFGFVFSFFIVFFYKEKKLKLLIIAMILCLLSLKRIALLAAMLGVAVVHTKHIWYRGRYTIPIAFAVANLSAIALLQFMVTEEFNEISEQYLNISSNQLLMGRVVIYKYILAHTELHWLYGEGPGSIYSYASSAVGSLGKYLAHSDILKLSMELGYLFVFSFFLLIYYSSKEYIEYVVSANLIMLTDNIFIYTSVFFILLFIISQSIAGAVQRDKGTKSCG